MFKNKESLQKDSLFQGDVIEKTPQVIERIALAHQYYANSEKYTHFLVITQSCDLVRRKGDFKAPYITIAAARPFRLVAESFIQNNLRNIQNSQFRFLNGNSLNKFRELLERHINNTEPDYFFLPRNDDLGLSEDIVVFLRLTIALKKEHYDALAESKIAEVEDIFQAKLGWLVGNIYSRVATPDVEEKGVNPQEQKRQFYDEYFPKEKVISLSTLQADILRELVKKKKSEINRDLTSEEVQEIIDTEIYDDIGILSNLIAERLVRNKVIDAEDVEAITKAKNAIANEPKLKGIIASRLS